jgi:hypothetical protein
MCISRFLTFVTFKFWWHETVIIFYVFLLTLFGAKMFAADFTVMNLQTLMNTPTNLISSSCVCYITFLTYMKLKMQHFFMDNAFMLLYRAFLRTGIAIIISLKLFDFVVNSFQMIIKRLQRNTLLQLRHFIFWPKPVLISSFISGSNVPVTFLCYIVYIYKSILKHYVIKFEFCSL